MSSEVPICLEDVNYLFGRGSLLQQILFDISLQVQAGERLGDRQLRG